jgi:predicted transcriptional regulator of viral defense system
MDERLQRKVVRVARSLGVMRPRDLDGIGVERKHLTELVNDGVLVRSGRGLYVLADADATEHHTLAEASKRVPHGVVCLLSALRYHELTTQNPSEVWLAIDRTARKPSVDYPPIRIVRFSGPALNEGVEERRIEKVPVRVYAPAKTVADCFKYRNKIGLDVALEALRETWRARKAAMDDLWKYAEVCRVANVMRPYMESLT